MTGGISSIYRAVKIIKQLGWWIRAMRVSIWPIHAPSGNTKGRSILIFDDDNDKSSLPGECVKRDFFAVGSEGEASNLLTGKSVR